MQRGASAPCFVEPTIPSELAQGLHAINDEKALLLSFACRLTSEGGRDRRRRSGVLDDDEVFSLAAGASFLQPRLVRLFEAGSTMQVSAGPNTGKKEKERTRPTSTPRGTF